MDNRTEKAKTEGAVWILEQLIQENPVHERKAARRVISEVMRAWPGNVERLWWKWLSEAAVNLNLRAKTLDCTVEEACLLAKDGAQLILFQADSESQWFSVLGASGGQFHTAVVTDIVSRSSLSNKKLKRALEGFATDEVVRCVVFHNQSEAASSQHQEQTLSPLDRLRRLLIPEWSDLWIVGVFAFVVSLLMLATPIAVEALVNTVAFGNFVQPIIILAGILFIFLGFQGAIRALQSYVVEIIQRRLFARVAGDLAFRITRAEQEATDKHHMPELVNRFFDIVTVQKVSAQLLLDGLGLILSTLIGMAVLGFYHPWLLGFDVLLIASIAFIILVLGRGAVSSAVKESKNKYYMAAWLEDLASCPVTFKSDGGAEFALERADRLIHEYLTARKSHFSIVMRQILFALGLQAVASTVLLGLGGWLVISGELTLGQLVAAELIVTAIVGAFAKFGKHMESFYDLLASVDKLGSLFDIQTERENGMLGLSSDVPISLQVNNASYQWANNSPGVSSVTFTVDPGKSLAILGSAGSGKSTLCDLIYGTRTPNSGYVKVDGFDPRDLRPDVLRNQVSLARGSEVFHASIEENIHLHHEDISAENVRDCLEKIGLLQPTMQLPDGYQTVLKADGAPLTENQCRLLALARAAIHQPGLLVVDGLLDGLPDEELEQVLSYLTSPENAWTLVITTGRESIAERCDRLIRLQSQNSQVLP